jgi:hypothetical protein
MDLSPFNLAKKPDVALIWGAGATRGASFVTRSSLCKPPLDVDFFQTLRSSSLSADDDVRRLLEFVETEFDSLDVGMENFYSQAFLFDQFVGDVPTGQKGRRRSYEWAIKRFRRLLPRVFEEAVGYKSCEHHERVASAVYSGDTFVSFNYDCLLDRALVRQARRRWIPAKSYGFDIGGDIDSWQDHGGTGRHPTRPLTLLKPHGSLNWRRAGNSRMVLRSDEFTHDGEDDLAIVPPLWQKSFEEEPYKSIWVYTRQVLAKSRALFIVGYSMPETDMYTQAALRMDVTDLQFLCIVNPDEQARKRIRSVLRSAVSVRTHLVELDYLADLAALFPSLADENEEPNI